ncbi:hypothetical protein SRHO_G00083410 [Serrasalmus rhombeus]
MRSQISSELVLCRVYISSLQHATMRRRFDVSQVLDHIFDDNESEDTQQQSDTDEQISEEEDDVEYQPEDTDTSDQSDEEVTGAEAAPAPTERFKSKSGICWSSVPPDIHGRADAANVIKMTSGITRFAMTRMQEESSGSDKKPIIILDYNKNKGGVDNLDKMTATYTCQRMTRRWPMVVFYNILDVSAYNAFVLWNQIHQG